MTRIGLFGGTFDPVHSAHLALARTAMQALALDELRWIPAGNPWQKERRLTSADHRAAMVDLVIRAEPGFVLDRCEIDRPGPSFTLDTVRSLQAAAQSGSSTGLSSMPDWFLLLGQDQYANLHTWRGWEELVQRVTLAVAARHGQVPMPGEALAAVPHRMIVLPMSESAVSASHLRQRLAAGASAASLVDEGLPPEVARYIDQHGLYRHESLQPLPNEERS